MEVGRIFTIQPAYGGGQPASHQQYWTGAIKWNSKYQGRLDMASGGDSLLAKTFNSAWVQALNMQEAGADITHFAMLHDDIVPDTGWLEVLLEDLKTSGADLISAVVPIKDPLGLTSTAIDDPDDEFVSLRRLTMAEIMTLPDIFDNVACGYPNNALLANTGCWVCHFTRPWRHKVHFTIKDKIDMVEYEEQGKKKRKFVVGVAPEDWNFSRSLYKLGCKVMCTKRVKLNHIGMMPYSNREDWGEFKYDMVLGHKFGNVPINADKNKDGGEERIST